MTGVLGYREFIPYHRIASAEPQANKHGTEMLKLFLVDGDIKRDVMTWDGFGETPLQLIPSEPGVQLLHVWTDGDDQIEWQVGRTPLIGWALCIDGHVRPVTASGVNDGCTEPHDIGNFVEMADGQVVSTSPWSGRATFKNADELLAYALKERGKPTSELTS
jgi:hypothetical protein